MRRRVLFTIVMILSCHQIDAGSAMAASDEPSGAVIEPGAADLIDVCRADGAACALALRLAVAWHEINREFEEAHPRYCLTENVIENGHARDAIIAIEPAADADDGMATIEAAMQAAFPCDQP
jgi:hypothetical protein